MFRHGFTLFLSLLVFLALCFLLTYSKLQGVDQYVGALTLSQSIYVQSFIEVLQEQFSDLPKVLLLIFLILSPVFASLISKKNRFLDLLIYLPMFTILGYIILGYQARISRELSERILIVWATWFTYGLIIFLLSVGILCYRKLSNKGSTKLVTKKKSKTAKNKI